MCWHFCGSVFVFSLSSNTTTSSSQKWIECAIFLSVFCVCLVSPLTWIWWALSYRNSHFFILWEKKNYGNSALGGNLSLSRRRFAHTSPKIPLNTRINEMKNNETAEIQRTWIIPASTRQQRTWVCNDMYHTGALKCQVSFGSKDPYFDQALVGTAGCGTICDFYLKTPSYLL